MTPAQIAATNDLFILTVNKRNTTSKIKTLNFEDIKNFLVLFKTALENFDKAFNLPANSGCFDVLNKLITTPINKPSDKPNVMKERQNKIRLGSLSRILKSSIVDADLSKVFKQDHKELQEAKTIYQESALFAQELINKYSPESKQDLNNTAADIAVISRISPVFSAPVPRRPAPVTSSASAEVSYAPLRPITIPVK